MKSRGTRANVIWHKGDIVRMQKKSVAFGTPILGEVEVVGGRRDGIIRESDSSFL